VTIVALRHTLTSYLVYPYERKNNDSMAMLSCVVYRYKTSGRKPLVIGLLLVMVILCGLWVFAFRMWHNMRPGRATRAKWRILDGNIESGLFSCSEL
jgi:hypothetical protein